MTMPADAPFDPVPVRLVSADVPLAVKQTSRKRRAVTIRSYILTAKDPVQEILPASDNRVSAQVIVPPAMNQASVQNENITAAGPAANAQVVAITLPAGLWIITWQDGVQGTSGSAETNNFVLAYPGGSLSSVSGGSVGTDYQQDSVQVLVPTGGATIAINVGATTPTGTASYKGQLEAAPSASPIVVAANKGDATNAGAASSATGAGTGAAAILPPGTRTPIDTTDPVWASATVLPAVVSVICTIVQPDVF